MKPKIFFIADKWADGRKELGLADWERNLQSSLQFTDLADTNVFHLDDHAIETRQRGDSVLLQKIREYKPDILCLITNKMPGTANSTPAWSTLDEIKNVLKIPMIAVWGDLEVRKQVKISKTLLSYTIFNPATAATAAIVRINRPDKYTYTWVPKDQRIFNNPNKLRDIDISYTGSSRKNRHKYIMYLLKNGLKVIYGGGERQEHLTTEQYADRYQRSKLTLSFSRAHSSHVVNARPFEATLCGAMLLEQESFELMKLYTPYIDYVPYTSKKDMLKKAQYYLNHDEERRKIALSGQQKTERLYSAKRFWQIVIDRALGTHSGQEYHFDYAIPEESLSHLTPLIAFKMKFLNSLCSTKVGFVVYKVFNWRYWQDMLKEAWHRIFFVPIGKLKLFLYKIMPRKTFNFILKVKRAVIKTH